jgi:Signal transduction histidine kinase regulating citrate/malate metabolism
MNNGTIRILLQYFPLWCTCSIFVFPLKNKDLFWLRYGITSIAFFIVGVIINILNFGIVETSIIIYLLSISVFFVLSNNKWKEAIYCSAWSVSCYKLILGIWSIIPRESGKSDVFSSYPAEVYYVLFVVSVSMLIGCTLARFMPIEGEYHIGPRQFVSTILLLIIFEILDYIMQVNGYASNNLQLAVLIIGAQFYCITVLYLQEELFIKSSIRNELDTINYLWKRQKEQYNLAKENIQIINQKCHDLKHQISALRLMSQEDKKNDFLKEIENSVDIYNSIINTQNEALDVILTEKSLYCQTNSIHINCVADGSQMDYISPVDLYTILGNALDNAIESVIKIKNKDKRFIDVIIHVKQRFLVINIINPFEDNLKFENGLPLSTKPNNGYHGYGLKSIRHTISKYDGYMTIDEKDNCFTLSILIPLPRKG